MKLVKVKYLKGKPGFEHVMSEEIAEILVKRGQVKILGNAKAEEKAKAKAEAEEKYKELLKIAAELGIKKPDKMKENELVEAIEAAKAENK